MSKTNTEKMAPETQTPEMANGMKLLKTLGMIDKPMDGTIKFMGDRMRSRRR